jgi:hypothetical protein
LIYTQFPTISDIGERFKAKGYETGVKGLMLHNSVAVTKSGVPLGLLKQSFFTHDDYRKKRGSNQINVPGSNKNIPIEDKESYRWIEHFRKTESLVEKSTCKIIHVADRECDIFEFLHEVENKGSHYVVRSQANRRTQEGPRTRDIDTIQNKLDQSPVIANLLVTKDNSQIECELRATSVFLKAPQRTAEAESYKLDHIKVNLVEVRNKKKSSKKLHWRLLTNLSCLDEQSALEVVEIYKKRWTIECFHRVLKSGFGVEKSRLATRSRLENMASVMSVVSWYIFWLYNFGRTIPPSMADKIFSADAINILKISAKKLRVPLQGKMTIKKAIFILARLGGFAGRKSDGDPGMVSIWRGWGKLHERMEFMEELTYG